MPAQAAAGRFDPLAEPSRPTGGRVAEVADAAGSNPAGVTRGGSNPSAPTETTSVGLAVGEGADQGAVRAVVDGWRRPEGLPIEQGGYAALPIPAPQPPVEAPDGGVQPSGGADAARRGGQEAQPALVGRHLVQIPVAAAARVGGGVLPEAMRRCGACGERRGVHPRLFGADCPGFLPEAGDD